LKYKIECKSLLLQKVLERFLDGFIDEEGMVISDYKGDIIIGKDIKKPFTKSQLLLQLENINPRHKISDNIKIGEENLEIDMSIFEEVNNTFEEKLDKLIDEFSQKLKLLIKEEYGKK
jgi:hypothetical protein